ncbi:MAG TPA: NADH:ubiquinone oxidoreductase [bacterium]|nr:NADH:ubiquinone oxidoreductase [bacterium]
MFDLLKIRRAQGVQYVRDVRTAAPDGFRGMPVIGSAPCKDGCRACKEACPTGAIALDPLALDLGRCVFCGECADACSDGKIVFGSSWKMAAGRREDLVLREGSRLEPVRVSESLHRIFGRSLRLRSVSAGGCNGCELELNALGNVNFDMGRFGIEFVASPRHADAVVVSGPVTANMAEALELAWDAVPDPRFVIAFGTCAISGEPFADSGAVDRKFLEKNAPLLFIPGCPPHPLTFISGILDLLGAKG